MYVATPTAWKSNVNKGLVWILCSSHKYNFTTVWMMVSNSEAHTGRPIGTSCSYFSIAWMSANVCVIGDNLVFKYHIWDDGVSGMPEKHPQT